MDLASLLPLGPPVDCHSFAGKPHPSPEHSQPGQEDVMALNPAAVSQLNLLPDFQWIPGHRFSYPCPSDLASDWFSLLNTCLGLCHSVDHGFLPTGWGKRLLHAKMTAELSPLWVPTVRRMTLTVGSCHSDSLTRWAHVLLPVDHQLLRRVLILWWPNLALPWSPKIWPRRGPCGLADTDKGHFIHKE